MFLNDPEQVRRESAIIRSEQQLNEIITGIKVRTKTIQDAIAFIKTQIEECPQAVGLLCNVLSAAYPNTPEFSIYEIYSLNVKAYDVMIAQNYPNAEADKFRYETQMSSIFEEKQ